MMNDNDLPELPGTKPPQSQNQKTSPLPRDQKTSQPSGAGTFSTSDIEAILDDDAAEIMGVIAEDFAANDNTEHVQSGDESIASARLSRDDFYSVFKMMFALPNMLPVPPFPIKALPVQDAEQEAARAASDAIYDIACETPFLSWLIEPGSEWMQRAMVIGAFSFGKLMAIKLELDARMTVVPQADDEQLKTSAARQSDEPAPTGDASTVVEIP